MSTGETRLATPPRGRRRSRLATASPLLRDTSPAPSEPTTVKETSYGSTDSLAQKRLVWFHDATGRDGELIERLIARRKAPKTETERQCFLALPSVRTNIWRLYEAAKESATDRQQVCRYYAGVGCGPRQSNEYLPSTTGSDWARRLKASYLDMAREYAWGDEIVLIGFSRGAYLCRAFAVILDRIGMVPASLAVDTVGTRGIDLLAIALDAYVDLFRGRREAAARADLDSIAATLKRVRQGQPGTSRNGGTLVHSLGLYDSVCAFSWPRCLGGKGGSFIWQRIFGDACPDERCPPNVEYAYHAVALAEDRIDYPLTHLVPNDGVGTHNIDVREVAFNGSHSDIGGGRVQHDISDITLCYLGTVLNSTTPSLLSSSLFSQLHEDHVATWAQMPPQLYTFSLIYGFEAACLLRRGPRDFVKTTLNMKRDDPLVLHASVPPTMATSLPAHAIVAPLLPAEEALKEAWTLQTIDTARVRHALDSRDILAWAVKVARRSL